MVSREDLKSPRLLVPAGLVALGGLLALLLLAISCPGEKTRLRQRIQKLEREKAAAETSATRWKTESKAKDQYLKSITTLLNDVASRIGQIEQDQKGLAALTVQKGGDSLRIVKNPSIPQALDRIDEQLDKNREQIGQLESLAAAESSENQNLKAVVDRLKKQNEGLDDQLQALRRNLGVMSKKVKTLEAKVGKLETDVNEKNEVIEEKDRTIGERETQLAEQVRQLEAAEAERWKRYYIVRHGKSFVGYRSSLLAGFSSRSGAPGSLIAMSARSKHAEKDASRWTPATSRRSRWERRGATWRSCPHVLRALTWLRNVMENRSYLSETPTSSGNHDTWSWWLKGRGLGFPPPSCSEGREMNRDRHLAGSASVRVPGTDSSCPSRGLGGSH